MQLVLDRDADRLGEPRRLVEPRLGVATAVLAGIGQRDDRAGAAREVTVAFAVEDAQAVGSSAGASTRLTGRSGCTVEMACL